MPRAKAVLLARKSNSLDIEFGRVPWKKFMQHKYVLSLAGNTYSSSFKHALRSGGCVVRQEERSYEWFEHFLIPWIHYVPVKWDLSDLTEQVEWALANDNQARKIAESGRLLGKDIFSRRKMACYTYVALQTLHEMMEYKLISPGVNRVPVTTVCESKRDKRHVCIRRKNSESLEFV